MHYAGLYSIARLIKKVGTENYSMPPLIIFLIALLHLVEILVYAVVYYVLHVFTNDGGFTQKFDPIFLEYVYISGSSYTTLGMSEFYPTGAFKFLTMSEALNGFMMLTWSATFFYSTAGQFLTKRS